MLGRRLGESAPTWHPLGVRVLVIGGPPALVLHVRGMLELAHFEVLHASSKRRFDTLARLLSFDVAVVAPGFDDVELATLAATLNRDRIPRQGRADCAIVRVDARRLRDLEQGPATRIRLPASLGLEAVVESLAKYLDGSKRTTLPHVSDIRGTTPEIPVYRRLVRHTGCSMAMQHVLIVDDNEDYADNLAEILEDEGHDVSVAYLPSAALSIAARLAFHVALLDVKMPEMDGVELLRLLQATHPEARYLMMTGFTTDARIADALHLGATEVLPKPVDLELLLALVGVASA